jgi:glutamate racemase
MKPSPIGVFDSGYGGLTILSEMVKTLPQYDFIYLGDNARAPYGDKSFETVYRQTLQCVKWLFDEGGCNLVILACNTASAKALRTIQQKDLSLHYPNKRVLGVIRPTAEIIGNLSTSKHIAVLGTAGTVNSMSYLIEIEKFFPDCTVSQEACQGWVTLVENNRLHSPEADVLVSEHLQTVLQKDPQIDTLLLACTHYPLLMNIIQNHLPNNIKAISQGEIVANSLVDYLNRHPEINTTCSKTADLRFFTTGIDSDFNSHASQFFGKKLVAEHIDLQ